MCKKKTSFYFLFHVLGLCPKILYFHFIFNLLLTYRLSCTVNKPDSNSTFSIQAN